MTEPTIDTLKANILTEFKQVLKLAPADYTENCTNVVMSLVDEYVADQVAKAKQELLSEIEKGLPELALITNDDGGIDLARKSAANAVLDQVKSIITTKREEV